MTDIYVLLIRSNSLFSRIIYWLTRAEYTHAAISFEPSCRKVYSFARKYKYFPLPAGFVEESVKKGLMSRCKKAPYALYRAQITHEQARQLERRFQEMLDAGTFHYSLRGTVLCFFGIGHKIAYHYFCSQFVAETLQDCGVIEAVKSASLYQPRDFANMDELKLCGEGVLAELQEEREHVSA